MRKYLIGGAIAAAILAGCSGGSHTSAPAVPSTSSDTAPSLSSQTVKSTLTVILPGSTSSSSSARKALYLPSSATSISLSYIGAASGSATPNPAATAPSAIISAGTFALGTSNCTALSGGQQCTVNPLLPVGTMNLYITATNSSGAVVGQGSFQLTVSATGAVTTTGSAAIVLAANITTGSVVTIGGGGALTPNQVNPVPVATSQAQSSAVYTISATAADGVTPIPAGTTISAVTISSADSSGNTCLVYVPTGTTLASATPCTYPAAGSTAAPIVLTNTSDTFTVQWNDKPISRAGFNLTGVVAGNSATPTPVKEGVTAILAHPAVATNGATGVAALGGGITFDPVGNNVYWTQNSATNVLGSVGFTATAGATYGTIAKKVVNIVGTTALTLGAPTGAVMGPDNNVWMTETGASAAGLYFGVYAANTATGSAAGDVAGTGQGFAATVAVGSVGETPNTTGVVPIASSSETAIVAGGGYVWALVADSAQTTNADNCIVRINPTTGQVLASGTVSTTTNRVCATVAAIDTTATTAFGTNAIFSGTNTILTVNQAGKVDTIVLNTSTTATAANLVTSVTESGVVGPALASGLISTSLGTDGTIYGANIGANAAGTIKQFNTAATSTVTYPGTIANLTEGGIAQTSLDSWIYYPDAGGLAGISAIASTTAPSVAVSANTYGLNLGTNSTAAADCIGTTEAVNAASGQGAIMLPSKAIAFAPQGQTWACFATF